MRKTLIIMLLVLFAGSLKANHSSIYNVRLVPQKDAYFEGTTVKIHWDTDITSSSEKVRITLWRQNGIQSTCRIAIDVPITSGVNGYPWKIPGKCTNPHTNQEENLTSTAGGKLKVRVRWMGHPDKGESHYFTIISLAKTIDFAETFVEMERKAKRAFLSNIPIISDVRLVEEDKKRKLYNVVWDTKNIPPNSRFMSVLLKNGRYYCDIRYNMIGGGNNFQVTMGHICQNKPDPVDVEDRVFQIEVALQNRPSVKGVSEMMKLPFYPDFGIKNVIRDKFKSGGLYFHTYKIVVDNHGVKTGPAVKVYLEMMDLDTGDTATLSYDRYYTIAPGNEKSFFFGYRLYHRLINARHQRIKIRVVPITPTREYNPDDNILIAEFDGLTRIR